MSTPFFHPHIFEQFPEIVALHSLRDADEPGNFSMLYGAPEEVLVQNRIAFAEAGGVPISHLAFPKLEHGKEVLELADGFSLDDRPVADAIITNRPGWLLGVAVADCVAILLYDPVTKVVAAVHSGWRGTIAEVAKVTVEKLQQRYHTKPADVWAFLSPSPTGQEYEVGHEVSQLFDAKYVFRHTANKDWLDNKAAVYDQLLAAGVPANHIEVDARSTLAEPEFHSARRDGDASGRMLVAIGLTEAAAGAADA
jgi:YfiH family protein